MACSCKKSQSKPQPAKVVKTNSQQNISRPQMSIRNRRIIRRGIH